MVRVTNRTNSFEFQNDLILGRIRWANVSGQGAAGTLVTLGINSFAKTTAGIEVGFGNLLFNNIRIVTNLGTYDSRNLLTPGSAPGSGTNFTIDNLRDRTPVYYAFRLTWNLGADGNFGAAPTSDPAFSGVQLRQLWTITSRQIYIRTTLERGSVVDRITNPIIAIKHQFHVLRTPSGGSSRGDWEWRHKDGNTNLGTPIPTAWASLPTTAPSTFPTTMVDPRFIHIRRKAGVHPIKQDRHFCSALWRGGNHTSINNSFPFDKFERSAQTDAIGNTVVGFAYKNDALSPGSGDSRDQAAVQYRWSQMLWFHTENEDQQLNDYSGDTDLESSVYGDGAIDLAHQVAEDYNHPPTITNVTRSPTLQIFNVASPFVEIDVNNPRTRTDATTVRYLFCWPTFDLATPVYSHPPNLRFNSELPETWMGRTRLQQAIMSPDLTPTRGHQSKMWSSRSDAPSFVGSLQILGRRFGELVVGDGWQDDAHIEFKRDYHTPIPDAFWIPGTNNNTVQRRVTSNGALDTAGGDTGIISLPGAFVPKSMAIGSGRKGTRVWIGGSGATGNLIEIDPLDHSTLQVHSVAGGGEILSLAVDHRGYVYGVIPNDVAGGGGRIDRLFSWDPSTASARTSWGSGGVGYVQTGVDPRHVAIAPNEDLVVFCQGGSAKVDDGVAWRGPVSSVYRHFNLDGTTILGWSLPQGAKVGCVDWQGSILVPIFGNISGAQQADDDQVLKFMADGTLMNHRPVPTDGPGVGAGAGPWAIIVSGQRTDNPGSGNVVGPSYFVLVSGSEAVVKFDENFWAVNDGAGNGEWISGQTGAKGFDIGGNGVVTPTYLALDGKGRPIIVGKDAASQIVFLDNRMVGGTVAVPINFPPLVSLRPTFAGDATGYIYALGLAGHEDDDVDEPGDRTKTNREEGRAVVGAPPRPTNMFSDAE